MVKRDFFPQCFLEIVSSLHGLKRVKNAPQCGLTLILTSFSFMASLVYLFGDVLGYFPSRWGWVSSKDFLRLKQSRNPSELLLDGFL